MNGRTFSRESFLEAKALWESGDFDGRWDRYRRLAAERGFIYPPNGSRFDSWEDEEPSQRAVVWQAIVDTPLLLDQAIGQARSWSDVVRKLIYERQVMRDELVLRERDEAWNRETAPRREMPSHIAEVLRRMSDSLP